MASPPNVLIFLVDDMGYADIGPLGGSHTPNVDSLAEEGILFTQWISGASVCTPSRASIQTGRLAVRSGLADNIKRTFFDPDQAGGLPPYEVTLANVAKQAGYKAGMSGKWHLGFGKNSSYPTLFSPISHGYDTWLGVVLSNGPQDKPYDTPKISNLVLDDSAVQSPLRMDNLTLMFTRHCTDFIEDAANKGQPFFYLFSFMHVHNEMFASDWFRGTHSDDNGGAYADNVQEMDWAVGAVLDKVRQLGLEQDTVVIFTSDNGPYREEGREGGSSGPLKGSKGQTYEGGIRVPGIVRWPGVAPANATTDTCVSSMDILPTVASLVGVQLPIDRVYDGHDILPIIKNPEAAVTPHDYMFHYCGTTLSGVRVQGRYKVLYKTANWTDSLFVDPPCTQCCPHTKLPAGLCMCDDMMVHDPPLVFDLSTDIGEKRPLTPSTFAGYKHLLEQVEEAVAKHQASLVPVPTQNDAPIDKSLQLCCNPPSCQCDEEIPLLFPPGPRPVPPPLPSCRDEVRRSCPNATSAGFKQCLNCLQSHSTELETYQDCTTSKAYRDYCHLES